MYKGAPNVANNFKVTRKTKPPVLSKKKNHPKVIEYVTLQTKLLIEQSTLGTAIASIKRITLV